MNRPTDELENLLSCADEAMAEGDFSEAVVILRQAARVAPLRRDVKTRLALALDGAPAQPRSQKQREPQRRDALMNFVESTPEPSLLGAAPESDFPDDSISTDQITETARKAFRAAADTTARATVAGRKLTNLLQNGIQGWKSSLMGGNEAATAASAVREEDPGASTNSAEAGIFLTDAELDSFIAVAPAAARSAALMSPAPEAEPPVLEIASSYSTYTPPASEPLAAETDSLPEAEEAAPPAAPIIKAAPASKRTGRAPARKHASRPSDVEDVLAAGLGSFVEAILRADKKKIAYACTYAGMAALLAFACFDASRKFPGVQAVSGAPAVATASLGSLDLSSVTTTPVIEARNLAAAGKHAEAITLLKNKLLDGTVRPANDPIRIELATQLNAAAEEKLRGNFLKESVNLYREAVGVMPGDSGLSLRLANSLYYLATMGNAAAEKKTSIKDGLEILDELVARGNGNLQVYRLRALFQEANGDKSKAVASWQKVKSMAAENSAEHAEAVAHLK